MKGRFAVDSLFALTLMIAILYFVMWRPQQKRQQQVASMLAALTVDDDVITVGGIHGVVVDLDDDSVDLRVSANGPVLRFQRSAIARIVPVSEESSDVDEDSDVSLDLDAVVIDDAPADASSPASDQNP